jgi:hypothetical protein
VSVMVEAVRPRSIVIVLDCRSDQTRLAFLDWVTVDAKDVPSVVSSKTWKTAQRDQRERRRVRTRVYREPVMTWAVSGI